jgi:hypothetical protein
MSDSEGDKFDQLSFARRNGVSVNKEGGYYCRGKQYGMENKLAVAATYQHYQQLYGGRPSLSSIAHEHKVDRKFVWKIESELFRNHGRVVSLEEVTLDMVSRQTLGPGTIALDQADCFALYCLMRIRPMRSLASYVSELYCLRGTMVSKMTVSRFFNHAFPIRAGLCVPNLVPYDKFCPHNIEKAVKYIQALARIDPGRLKFANEKSFKGKDIYNKKIGGQLTSRTYWIAM